MIASWPTPQVVVALWLALSVFAPLASAQEDDARRWLRRMVESSQTLNYTGTFVYVQGQHLEAMRIIHGHDEDGERQRLVSLNGAAREVVVADDRLAGRLPRQRVILRGGGKQYTGLPVSLPVELGSLERLYRFEVLGDDRIAGKPTRVIGVMPRDSLRFGYHLWLDQETGMVLRSVLLDEHGQVVEQLMFTNLEVTEGIPPALLEAGQPAPAEVGMQAEDAESASGWHLASLPTGFVEARHGRFHGHGKLRATEHIVLTDGLATVSVFLEEMAGADPVLEGPSSLGAMNAFGRIVDGHQVLVVGEVPVETVEMIAAAVTHEERPEP